MEEMTEKFDELEPDRARRLFETLGEQRRESLSYVSELDKRITNTNFVTNGGGAVAVLAFLGTGTNAPYLNISLLLFALGLVATGIELRALLKYWFILHTDSSRRHNGFLNGKLTVRECLVPEGLGKKYQDINHCAGWVSQGTFVLGVLVGGVGFVLFNYT